MPLRQHLQQQQSVFVRRVHRLIRSARSVPDTVAATINPSGHGTRCQGFRSMRLRTPPSDTTYAKIVDGNPQAPGRHQCHATDGANAGAIFPNLRTAVTPVPGPGTAARRKRTGQCVHGTRSVAQQRRDYLMTCNSVTVYFPATLAALNLILSPTLSVPI